MKGPFAAMMVACLACLGCGVDLQPHQGSGKAGGPGTLGGQVVPGGLEELSQPVQQSQPASPATAGQTTALTPNPTTLVPAEAGVGKQGQGYGGGIITEPIRQRFRAEQRIIFDQIQHAIDLYKALNDGRAPQTHEEFMEKIIAENQIVLPELPPGHRYVYDPQKEELMVERPAN